MGIGFPYRIAHSRKFNHSTTSIVMRNILHRWIPLVLLAFGGSCLQAQNCYVFKDEASGFDVQSKQSELEAKACELVAAFDTTIFADSFKVFSFGFYVDLEYYGEYSYPQAFLDVEAEIAQESPYYLLIGRQTDPSGIFTKFWVKIKLPEAGNFWCMNEFDRIALTSDISRIIDSKYNSEGGSPSNFYLAEKEGMDSLKSSINDKMICCGPDPQAKNLCGGCYAPSQAATILTSLGFRKFEGELVQGIPSLGNSHNVEDYSHGEVDISGSLSNLVNHLDSLGYSAKGFITAGTCLSGPDFYTIQHKFDTTQVDLKIWWHAKIGDNGKFELYEIVNDFSSFLNNTTYENPPSDSLTCKGTKRWDGMGLPPEKWGPAAWEGVLAHKYIESYYLNEFPPMLDTGRQAEYLIPASSSNGSGNVGYADMVSLTTGEIFEIKPVESLNKGLKEVNLYVSSANNPLYGCTQKLHPDLNPKKFVLGYNFTMPDKPFPLNRKLRVELALNGVVTYEIHSRGPNEILPPSPPIPPALDESIRRMIRDSKRKVDKLPKDISEEELQKQIDEAVKEQIRYHYQDFRPYVDFIVTVGVVIIAATIVEDIITLGIGLLDDPVTIGFGLYLINNAEIIAGSLGKNGA
jgi:hypothetical protein